MRGSLKRSAVATVGLLVLAWAVLPMAIASAATEKNLRNGDEAWFQRFQEPLAESPSGDPTCELPTGCNAAGNVTRDKLKPHPEGTLVVGANGGEADAQIFFNFDMNELPIGAVVTGGTVTMPVATDDKAGNARPEAAKLVACIVTGFVPGGAEGGSWQDRPEFDDGTCVKVEQDDTADTLTYTFDLERFGKAWGSGTKPMQGVTILKDPEVTPPAPQETWRVVFNSARRAAEDEAFKPITSDVQYTVKAAGLGTVTVPDTGGDLGGGGGGFDTGTSGGGFDTGTTGGGFDTGTSGGTFDSGAAPAATGSITPPQSAPAPSVESADSPTSAEEQPIAAPAAQTQPTSAPGMSPAVWILPLLAVAMAGALAWSLMQPVELVGEREGAVSKLMRSRRLAASDTSNPA